MNRALFLDRDGVVNADRGYVYLKEHFEFTEGIFDLCREYADGGYILIIITNQAGIAKGLYTEADFNRLTKWMTEEFSKEGITITKAFCILISVAMKMMISLIHFSFQMIHITQWSPTYDWHD